MCENDLTIHLSSISAALDRQHFSSKRQLFQLHRLSRNPTNSRRTTSSQGCSNYPLLDCTKSTNSYRLTTCPISVKAIGPNEKLCLVRISLKFPHCSSIPFCLCLVDNSSFLFVNVDKWIIFIEFATSFSISLCAWGETSDRIDNRRFSFAV